MSKEEKEVIPKVNFFDSQRITQIDLESEQSRISQVSSNLVTDFHGSGVILKSPFEQTILLDTRNPGRWAENSNNPSESVIQAGSFDGKAIYLDKQPSDVDRGNRISFELIDSLVAGRNKTKIMVVGKSFDGLGTGGKLVCEFIEFEKNESKLSQHYYVEIIAIFFNNFSGGTGKNYFESTKDNLDLTSESGGYLIVKEAESLSVYPQLKQIFQLESPNYDFNNFITSSVSLDLSEEIEIALGGSNSISDIYIEQAGNGTCLFEKNGSTAVMYGQKFLAKTNNIQSIDLLLSVPEDGDQPEGEEFYFSGNIVVGIYELTTDAVCSTDAIPNNLIDFDPEISPILEVSLNQAELEVLGYKLKEDYQVVRFNFSNTLISNPNIDPSLIPGKYYALLVSRRGDNQVGTVRIEKGFDKATKKEEEGVPLFAKEQFGKQETKFFEYDPVTKRYVNDSDASLWFCVNSDCIEVVNGEAYLQNGKRISMPKTELYVGSSEVSRFYNNIPLKTVVEGDDNYIVLSYKERFAAPVTHPISGDYVSSRVYEEGDVVAVNSNELSDLTESGPPMLLAKVKDNNVRYASQISGSFDKPGLIQNNKFIIIDPLTSLLNANLVGRIITPDTGCSCNAKYRIVKTVCRKLMRGDLNSDGALTSADITLLLGVAGNTINSATTERAIWGGSLDILDFIKSDLNDDETIDGTDIELLEDAVDGYVNFTVPESFNVLEIYVENIFEEDDFPTLFVDAALSGVSASGEDEITFVTTEQLALIVRPGDQIEILAGADAGNYIIESKSVANDGITVTVTVTDLGGDAVSFLGDTGFNVSIVSGTAVNVFSNNNDLVNVPFEAKDFEINFINDVHKEAFIQSCDLRRFVQTAFIEEKTSTCLCETVDCSTPEVCSPQYKNQLYLPGDLYLPNGNILLSPGVPHPGDFEYVNISVPMPPGTLTGCSIDLYNTFIKSESGTCKTAAGYDAMKYSDGTYVGCEDDEGDTDITKGRVKFSQAIASLHVDAFIDGYAVDGYANDYATVETYEHILENYKHYWLTDFAAWTSTLDSMFTISDYSPAVMNLITTSDIPLKSGLLSPDAPAQNFSGDFIIDIMASRIVWDYSANGIISAHVSLSIANNGVNSGEFKLGWKSVDGETKMFFSGEISDISPAVIETFDFQVDAIDPIGEVVAFRLRRAGDVITAWYVIPSDIAGSTANSYGQYVRIGSNTTNQPGDGDATLSLEMTQESAPDVGVEFEVSFSQVEYFTDYVSSNPSDSVILGKDAGTLDASRLAVTFPLSFSKKTNIVSAILNVVPVNTDSTADLFDIIPFEMLNASNLGLTYNYPETIDPSIITSFSPGSYVADTPIEVDILNMVNFWVSRSGHLPGYKKAFLIKPQDDSDFSFEFKLSMDIVIGYEDITTGVVFKVGANIDLETGIVTFNTKNILYDAGNLQNRTVIDFGVFLKKSGFKNKDISLGITELKKVGLGLCEDTSIIEEGEQCYFVVGTSGTGVFIEGPFDCLFQS